MSLHPFPQNDLSQNFTAVCRLLSGVIIGNTTDNLTRLLNDLPPMLGLKHIAYVELEKDTNVDVAMFSVVSTYSLEWQLRYVARGYAAVDPIFLACRNGASHFDWRSTRASSPNSAAFFADAAAHGIGENGYSLRVPTRLGAYGMASFNSDLPDDDWESFKLRYLRNLEVVACLIASAASQNQNLPSKKIVLSSREHQALSWAARGKTASEIGLIMGTTYATARSNLESARHKLDCQNVTHAVATALAIGLIPPVALRGSDPVGFSGRVGTAGFAEE